MTENSYTVTEREGCRIVTGTLPLSSFGAVTAGLPKDAVMDTNLARMLGAMMVVGTPEALAKLKASPDVVAQARAQAARYSGSVSAAAAEWLATGEQGSSSVAMFRRFTGVGEQSTSHPHDPDDLRRCLLLLEQVPEFREKVCMMADVSRVWAALVERWDELCATMDAEAPQWRESRGRAPKTYDLMKSIGC